jgi:hypothetical protein
MKTAATKPQPTAAWQRAHRKATDDARQNAAAFRCVIAQWKKMQQRGPLQFNDAPSAEVLSRREELKALTPEELHENIVEHEERRRDKLRTIVVSDPVGDAHIKARLQRAHDRKRKATEPAPAPESG